jgi:hypothetical protein
MSRHVLPRGGFLVRSTSKKHDRAYGSLKSPARSAVAMFKEGRGAQV